jgi:hypothetical protein
MCGVYSHLDRVFLMVVNKGNILIVSLNTIDYHTCHALSGARLQDSDMVDSFSVSVVYLECLPISREARCETQFVYFKPQPQK